MCAGVVDYLYGVEQIPGRSCEPVEFPNNDRVARPELVKHTLQLRPLSADAGNLLAEGPTALSLLQSVELQIQILVLRRYPGITDLHTAPRLQKFLHKD